MTLSPLKPIFVMATLCMAVNPAWGAQNPEPAPTAAMPSQTSANAAPKTKAASAPAKPPKIAPKRAAPHPANYNVGEPPTPVKSATKPHPKAMSKKKLEKLAFAQRIDINSASKEELKKLPGVFDAEAAKIIAHRPYKSKAGLVVDAGLTGAQYFAIKDRVKALQ